MKCKANSASADGHTLGERFVSLIHVALCKAVDQFPGVSVDDSTTVEYKGSKAVSIALTSARVLLLLFLRPDIDNLTNLEALVGVTGAGGNRDINAHVGSPEDISWAYAGKLPTGVVSPD